VNYGVDTVTSISVVCVKPDSLDSIYLYSRQKRISAYYSNQLIYGIMESIRPLADK
jgi:hypothetical protein